MDQFTIDQFKKMLPDRLKGSVNKELVDQITNTLNEPDMFDTYRENLLSHASVMADGRFKMSSYVSAVKYVSHKLMGKSNIEAFTITFPDKIKTWTAQGVAGKDIASYVTAYNKSKLVNLIFEQTLIPSWVLNQDLYQKALNKQAELMLTANSEKVQCEAANSILTHLKPPDKQVVELNLGVKQDSVLAELRNATQALVAQQRKTLQTGALNAQQLIETKVVTGEVVSEQ